MALNKLNLAILILILILSGCIKKEKDELTLPGKFKLSIAIESSGYEFLSFGGKIGIQRIRFEGYREAGEDVFFETEPKMNLPLLTFSNPQTYISDFDIPRGVYNYMKWDIDLKRIGTNELFYNYGADSLKNIGLVFSGTYDFGYGEDPLYPIYFAIDDTVKFSFRSKDGERFVLSENKNYEVILLFDPHYIFSKISQDSIQKLDTSGAIGHQIIIISSNKNEDMYKRLLSGISQSTRILF